jgi:short-subunit dehydrogenase
MSRETALVTGASSGIGLELAKLFAARGANLVLVARNEAGLSAVAADLHTKHGVAVRALAADLTRPEAPAEIFETLRAERIEIDTLVNNAGFGKRGKVADLDPDEQLDMLQVNAASLTHLTRLFLPGMLARRRGNILNVASTAAFQPGPGMAVYYATKAYVLFFTEALADEVKDSGIKVCCLAPGPTHTAFAERADAKATRLFARAGDAASVAAAGYQGLRAGKTLVIPGFWNRTVAFLTRLAPRFVARRVVQWLQA